MAGQVSIYQSFSNLIHERSAWIWSFAPFFLRYGEYLKVHVFLVVLSFKTFFSFINRVLYYLVSTVIWSLKGVNSLIWQNLICNAKKQDNPFWIELLLIPIMLEWFKIHRERVCCGPWYGATAPYHGHNIFNIFYCITVIVTIQPIKNFSQN